ncbi:putative aspartic proteinase GIP2 [Sesamum alatum]|uniref:Aspartic proteinase GIP2 n=1 Tax=Sesamum alatum TaxID=300844 RepID=A0AAE1XRF9_9LAMI|nr:putative aspartic proteinase GIP2 [Sesamum alatum]
MAPSTLSIFLFSLLLLSPFSNSQSPPKPQAFIFPIKKDVSTNQYYTTIQIGSSPTTFNVVIDLGGKFLWFNSLDYFNAASSYRPILCGTPQCRIAEGVGCVFCFLSPPVPGCTNNTCSDYALNPFTGTQGYNGLGQDVLRVYSTRGDQYRVNDFPFQFSDPVLRQGLASPTAGLIGLGRTRISLQAQLASAFKIRQKFALCLPSSGNDGNMIVGQGAYSSPFPEIAKSLLSTPLIRNPVSTFGNEQIGNLTVEYFIDVKSIRVGEKTLSFNKTLLSINKNTGAGGTSIRTVRPYTGLHRSILNALITEFVEAAASKNITRVVSVAPFEACFDSKTVGSSKTGPDVPTIDLVLQSKSLYWRFYGSNSMVRVSSDVICLAFVDGGSNLTGPTTSVVVGGHQLENHLLEFDVSASRLRFSSSLLLHGTSCSQFRAS